MTQRENVFTIVLVIGAYLVAQAVADVGATKLVQVGGVVIPGGTFVFALTFTLRDLIHKRLGKEWARAAIITAGLMMLWPSCPLRPFTLTLRHGRVFSPSCPALTPLPSLLKW